MSETIWQRAGGVSYPTGLSNYIPTTMTDPNQVLGMDFQKNYGFAHDAQMARLNQQPQMEALNQKAQHWNALFPMLQQGLSGLNGSFSSRVGGQSGTGPRINAAPIWDAGKIQGQVNANRAQGAQETAGQVQQMQNRLAGSGYGANSPLAQALQTQMRMSNMGSVADQNRQFTQNAAQQNASHVLSAQQAQEGQYSNRMQEDIARRRNVIGQQQGLLGLLGQFL